MKKQAIYKLSAPLLALTIMTACGGDSDNLEQEETPTDVPVEETPPSDDAPVEETPPAGNDSDPNMDSDSNSDTESNTDDEETNNTDESDAG